jgi:hypothetical protein
MTIVVQCVFSDEIGEQLTLPLLPTKILKVNRLDG